jgi:hypothetical protein
MQLLIADPSYADWNGDRAELLRELEDALLEIGPHDLKSGDIGPGADWPMFLAIFSAVGTVFLLGERIDKSIDAWVSLSRKLANVLEALRRKFGATRVDAVGASLLALKHIAEKEGSVRTIRALTLESLPIHEFEGRDSGRLDSRYSAVYMQAYEVNGESIYAFVIRADGEIDVAKKYGSQFMTFGPPTG